jgi:hypothetical protein
LRTTVGAQLNAKTLGSAAHREELRVSHDLDALLEAIRSRFSVTAPSPADCVAVGSNALLSAEPAPSSPHVRPSFSSLSHQERRGRIAFIWDTWRILHGSLD